MAPVASFALACYKGFNDYHLTRAIFSEAERGYPNRLGDKMRFSSFLHSNLLKWCARSNDTRAQKLLEDLSSYNTASLSERSKFLSEVSVLMGYNSIEHLVELERVHRSSGSHVNGMFGEFDFTLARGRYPCIKFGDSSFVALYDEVPFQEERSTLLFSKGLNKYLPTSVDQNSPDTNKLDEAWQVKGPSLTQFSNIHSPLANEGSSNVVVYDSQEADSAGDHKANAKISRKIFAKKLGTKSLEDRIPEILDKATSCNPRTTSRQRRQLQESQFHTEYDSQEADSAGEAKSNAKISSKKSATKLHTKSSETNMLDEEILDKIVSCIPRMTSRKCGLLEGGGFHTVRKLLNHFPRSYVDLQNVQGAVDDGQYVIFVGTVSSSRGIKTSSLSLHEVVVCSQHSNEEPISETEGDQHHTGESKVYFHLKKFFSGSRFTNIFFLRRIASKYEEGKHVLVSGRVKKLLQENHYEIREFSIDILGEEEQHGHVERGPYPIYPSKLGLKASFLRDTISRALQILPTTIDPLPSEILVEFKLLSLRDAYMGIHCPKNENELNFARKRLIFDEFFYLQLGRLFKMLEPLGTQTKKDELLEKYIESDQNAVTMEEWSSLTKKLLKSLPYSLTRSQLNAVSEIIWDLNRRVPMNRLLQGDVGCGKTVVAFLACMEVISSGFQAAFMVPTELLAVQHYEHLLSLLENLGESHSTPSIALLTGSTSSKQSRAILNGIQSGEISMVIGTHSLIAEKVVFAALRIAVVDEQHRFGVIQRGTFTSKLYPALSSLRMQETSLPESVEEKTYMAPHILAMSATPIPRTMALALYGDMSLTQITDLPPGRFPVETIALEANDKGFDKMLQMIRDELVVGGKIFLVYPVINESEQLPQLRAATSDLGSMSRKFDGYQCGLLHGRMMSEEKNDALRKFRSGETRILLATTVIEIGVDIPDASMMVVMNAERFGIAQLHQLRGRVGRGSRKSKCIFMSSASGAWKRLKVLEKSSNGFDLAKADLLLRGPGNLLGARQSGHLPDFPIARLEIDGEILEQAHYAALMVLSISSDLQRFPKLKGELSMRQPLCILGD